jgi:hypothetical protein
MPSPPSLHRVAAIPTPTYRRAHLAGYAGAIIAAFSDLEFEIVKEFECGEGAMVAEWLMKGTHDGEMRGLPPTGRRVVNCSQGSPLSASVMRPEAATI